MRDSQMRECLGDNAPGMKEDDVQAERGTHMDFKKTDVTAPKIFVSRYGSRYVLAYDHHRTKCRSKRR